MSMSKLGKQSLSALTHRESARIVGLAAETAPTLYKALCNGVEKGKHSEELMDRDSHPVDARRVQVYRTDRAQGRCLSSLSPAIE